VAATNGAPVEAFGQMDKIDEGGHRMKSQIRAQYSFSVADEQIAPSR